MAHGKVSAIIPASCAAVFDLLHDYERRLEWDTLLQAAYLDDGFTAAGKGVTSVCVGRRTLGGVKMRTIYVSFDRAKVAAVKLLGPSWLFARWAASIKHAPLGDHESRITYTFDFTARPTWLRWAFEPVLLRVFRWETNKRLRALRDYFQAHPEVPETRAHVP